MSSDIWTQCAGRSEIRSLTLVPWRVVESQHQISTRKLVDTLEEQALLEALIDGAKPPDATGGRQHYLLFTPFRYPPLRHGSRFGDRNSRGIWYGAELVSTAMAEVAYYRLVFLEGTTAALDRLTVELTAFRAKAHATHGVDLVAAPFAAHRSAIASPVQYESSQALGAAMRADGVEACRYPSARDPAGGVNVAVFSPRVFGRSAPRDFQRWQAVADRTRVELSCRDYTKRAPMVFDRMAFLVDGRLPMPAIR
jgi:hypothetical protein